MNRKITVEKREFNPELCRDLEPLWDALLACSSRPTIYSTFDYFNIVYQFPRERKKIFLLLFRDISTGDLLAIFPMGLSKQTMCGLEFRVLTHGMTPVELGVDKPYPLIRKDSERDVWTRFRDYIRREYTNWDLLTYEEFTPESDLILRMKKLFSFPRYWTKTTPGPDSPIVRLDGDWEEFWMKHKKLRKKTRQLERKLGANLAYIVTSDPADIQQCLDNYIATELSSWKAGQAVSSEEHYQFYRDLFMSFATKKRIHFGTLYDGASVVSMEVAYTFNDRVFFAHGTYDPAYADLSPGAVNSCWFIRHFHGKGFVEGDYLAGYAHYNNPWACRIDKSVNVIIRKMNWKNWYLAFRHLVKKTCKK